MDLEFINSFNNYQRTGNIWRDLNPLTKLNICFAVAFIGLIMTDYRFGAPLVVACCVLAVLSGKIRAFLESYIPIALTVIIFITLIRQIGTRPENVTPLINIFGWQWYKEAFIDGMNTISFIMTFSGWLTLYFVTTPMHDLMITLEKKGMSHEISFIMLSSMQSIIDLKKAAVVILESQKSRGIETEGNIFVRARAFFPTLGPLILGAITSTEEKVIAMDARAFTVNRKHTFLRDVAPVTKGEIAFIWSAWGLCVLSIIYKVFPLIMKLF